MVGSSSSGVTVLHPLADDFYFSALFDATEIFPISDEKYAEELALQETLMSENFSTSRTRNTKEKFSTSPIETLKGKMKLENGQSSSQVLVSSCVICMDAKPTEEMFRNDNCTHSVCTDCIGKYVATKVKENIPLVRCPEPKCGGVFEPQLCSDIVPKEVF